MKFVCRLLRLCVLQEIVNRRRWRTCCVPNHIDSHAMEGAYFYANKMTTTRGLGFCLPQKDNSN